MSAVDYNKLEIPKFRTYYKVQPPKSGNDLVNNKQWKPIVIHKESLNNSVHVDFAVRAVAKAEMKMVDRFGLSTIYLLEDMCMYNLDCNLVRVYEVIAVSPDLFAELIAEAGLD